jgi:iron complex outermembrane receptor protein
MNRDQGRGLRMTAIAAAILMSHAPAMAQSPADESDAALESLLEPAAAGEPKKASPPPEEDSRSAAQAETVDVVPLADKSTPPKPPSVPAKRPQLEEIVVTAQRREQSLQDVPLAVSALGAEALEQRGIGGLQGLTAGEVPSLRALEFAGRPSNIQLTVRGVGNSDPAQISLENAVAVYVDDVYVSRSQGVGAELAELERIEVLRGPQGTLFGRNAVGGAVNIISRKPRGEFRFNQEFEYGRFNALKSRTIVETPEWNRLSFKLGYLSTGRDGLVKNPAPGEEDLTLQQQQSARLAARWLASEQVSVDYAFETTDIEYTNAYNQLLTPSTNPLLSRAQLAFVETERRDRVAGPGLLAPVSSTQVQAHNLILEWDLTDQLTFKSITGYRKLEDADDAILGFGLIAPVGTIGPPPLPGQQGLPTYVGGFQANQRVAHDQSSQELQLFATLDRVEYTLGLTYFDESATSTDFLSGTLEYFETPNGPEPRIAGPTLLEAPTVTELALRSYGAYGQLTWTPPIVADRLSVTLGLRYSQDEKKLVRTLLAGMPTNIPVNVEEERIDPAVSIAYAMGDEGSMYLRVARAFRGGGASARERPAQGDLTDTGFHAYGAEEVTIYELGLKSDFWDRRARLNAAVFHQDQRDKQLTFQKPGNNPANTRIFNADKPVKIEGAEIELTLIPLDSLTLNLSGIWLRDDLSTVTSPLNGQTEEVRLAQFPEYSWTAAADYRFPWQPLGGSLSFFVNASGSTDYCFNERSCFGRHQRLRGGSGSNTAGDDNILVNARLALSEMPIARGALSLALWGRNLTDQQWLNFGFSVPGDLDTGVVIFGDPRTYGLTLTYEYF